MLLALAAWLALLAGFSQSPAWDLLKPAQAAKLGLAVLACVSASAWAGMQFSKFGALALFAAGLGLACLALQDSKARRLGPGSPWAWLFATGLGALVVVLGAAWFRSAFWEPTESGNVAWMFPPRASSASEPIPGGAFTDWPRLWALLACAAGLLGGLALGWKAMLKRPLLGLAFLWAASLAARLAVEHLSPLGISLLWLKGSTIHSSFLHVALERQAMGAWGFLKGFHALQEGGLLPVHAGTHGPLPELFYWACVSAFGRNPAPSVLAYMALQASLVVPVYSVGRRLSANTGTGLAAAALAAFTPQALILGNAGFDAMMLTLLAWSFWFFLKALDRDGRAWALAAGLVFWLAQMASMLALLWPVFFGLFAWVEGRSKKGLAQALKAYGIWLGLPLALHLGLWALTAGDFSYLQSSRLNFDRYAYDEAFFHKAPPRHYWAWGNLLLYAAWASLPLLAAWGLRTWEALKQGGGRAFDWLGAGMLLMLALTVMSTREVNRDHIWASFFLFLPAAEYLAAKDGKKAPPLLLAALGLMLANAAVLEILVFDQY